MKSAARTCECDAPRCERDGCQDKPTPRRDIWADPAAARERLYEAAKALRGA